MGKQKSVQKLMNLMASADEPFNEDVVAMDCKEDCEDIAQLAERVANGENLKDIYPEYFDHLNQIRCSKEEFEALVSVIRAELAADQAQDS